VVSSGTKAEQVSANSLDEIHKQEEVVFVWNYDLSIRQKVVILCFQQTPWSRAFSEKLTVSHLVKNSESFMESEGSLPCSQQPATRHLPWARRIQSTPYLWRSIL